MRFFKTRRHSRPTKSIPLSTRLSSNSSILRRNCKLFALNAQVKTRRIQKWAVLVAVNHLQHLLWKASNGSLIAACNHLTIKYSLLLKGKCNLVKDKTSDLFLYLLIQAIWTLISAQTSKEAAKSLWTAIKVLVKNSDWGLLKAITLKIFSVTRQMKRWVTNLNLIALFRALLVKQMTSLLKDSINFSTLNMNRMGLHKSITKINS